MSDDLSSFHYRYKDNKVLHTLFCLHGTGGSEHDFLFLDESIGSSFNLVGLRGNSDEGGAHRFFRRFAPGVFDQESIRTEATKLNAFINAWRKKYGTRIEDMVFLGYSNGANMLLATMFLYPDYFQTVVLLHPMMPMDAVQKDRTLSSHTAFVSFGLQDSMVPPDERQRVIEALTLAGADVIVHDYPGGHEIRPIELHELISFLQRFSPLKKLAM